MKKQMQKIVSLVLCTVLCVGMCVPVRAANENNSKGVTYNAILDTPVISTSNTEQTVVMRLNTNKAVTVDGIGFTVIKDSPLTITSIKGGQKIGEYPSASTNLDKGIAGWQSPDSENVSGVTELAIITFKVPANIPAGTYKVGVEKLELTQDYGEIWERSASAETTLTVTEKAEGYTAGISTLTKELSVDTFTEVEVAVGHSSDTSFAAGEIVIQYDNEKLEFNKERSTLGNATVKAEQGTLTIEDYGQNKNFSNGVYTLAFKAIKDGNAQVQLSGAAFVNKESAAKQDLISATLSPTTLNLVVRKKTFSVDLPNIFIGNTEVEEGSSYTFSKADGENYNYSTVTATMNGVAAEVVNNVDGTYTISNVTGPLVISGTRTEKNYTVSFSGNAAVDIENASTSATYNTNYVFTMPTASGWAYSLESITIGGEAYTGYSVENSQYTIPGTAIKGNIVITVKKVATETSVIVEGSGAGAAAGYESKVTIGADYTLRLTPESGYTYTVTAKMGGNKATVIDNNNHTYTIKNVTADVVFVVERHVVVTGVSVSEYLSLNGTKMWLVKNKITLADGKVPTYNGQKMFWSEKYGTYCYLVVSATLAEATAKTQIGIIDGTATTVDYGMDVNMTGRVDASDPQLVYNMYNAEYMNFTEDVTMEKFLRADVNGDGLINVKDPIAIISNILK